MSVAFDGFNRNTATFKITEDIEAGTAVKITESAQVEPCADGDAFCGFVENGDNGYAAVQLSGAVTAVYSGSAPEVGFAKLASDGSGVKASDSGREYLVVAVDETASTVTFIM